MNEYYTNSPPSTNYPSYQHEETTNTPSYYGFSDYLPYHQQQSYLKNTDYQSTLENKLVRKSTLDDRDYWLHQNSSVSSPEESQMNQHIISNFQI